MSGSGSGITNLDYNNITLNKPTNFQSDWNTTIINKPSLSFLPVVYMCYSTVPIYFWSVHSASNEFSAIHFELNFNAVKDIETKLMP